MIIGVGSSAGGLEALGGFLSQLPRDAGISVILVQHLAPDSNPIDILGRHSVLPLSWITDGARIEPDHAYLIPPYHAASLVGDSVQLMPFSSTGRFDFPIDFFFRSLAEAVGDRAVGIILSGTGTDGAHGARAIQAVGGLVLAQLPESASEPDMPEAAIGSGACNEVLEPAHMAAFLLRQTRSEEGLMRRFDGQLRADVLELLKARTGLDFSGYKKTTLMRRILRRMEFQKIDSIENYALHLRESSEELDLLHSDLLIGFTEFFRDADVYELLEKTIIPEIFQLNGEEGLRVWIAGCATGEEAYSMAMLFDEAAARRDYQGKISIFATDVSRIAVERAAAGVYSADRVVGISEERLGRYFIRESNQIYRVTPELRRRVVFSPHNLVADPPFTRLHLACCRNLLIYFNQETRDRALALLNFALRPGGVLLLGTSESPGKAAVAFAPVQPPHKIFRKVNDLKSPLIFGTTSALLGNMAAGFGVSGLLRDAGVVDRQLQHDFELLIERHLPPGFILRSNGDILHFLGATAPFLVRPRRRVQTNVMHIVDEGLHVALNLGLQQAKATGGRARIADVRLAASAERPEQLVSIVVEPLPPEKPGTEEHFHVTLEVDQAGSPPREPAAEFKVEPLLRDRLFELEEEVQSARQALQQLAENAMTAHEELLASNEELQSANEESQSMNEELQTLNAEFQKKNAELSRVNQEQRNLLASLDIGVIFVDAALEISKYNEASEAMFKLRPNDLGRSVSYLDNFIMGQGHLLADAERGLQTGVAIERETQIRDGRWLLQRITPLRDSAGSTGGVILCFTDITGLKGTEHALRESEQRFQSFMNDGPLIAWIKDERGRYVYVNDPFTSVFQVAREACLGRTAADALPGFPILADVERDRAVLRSGATHEFLTRVQAASGTEQYWLVKEFGISNAAGGTLACGYGVDVTARQEARVALARSVERFRRLFIEDLTGDFIAQPDGVILESNPAFQSMFHVSEQDARERGVVDFFMSAEDWQTTIDLLRTGTKVEGRERSVILADGKRVDIAENLSGSLSAEGVLTEVRGYCVDITARNRALSELAFQASLYRNIQEAIIATDRSMRIISWNQGAEQTYGWPSAEAVGAELYTLLRTRPDDRETLVAALAAHGSWSGELRQETQAGVGITVLFSVSALADPNQAAAAFVVNARDVSGQREMQERIAETQKMDSIGVLAAGIAHDFNNMLAAILGYSNLLEGTTLDEQQTALLTKIVGSTQRAADLPRKILGFARKGKNLNQPVDLNAIVNEAHGLVQNSLAGTVSLIKELLAESATIDGDPGQILQMVMNLLINANEALSESGTITVSTRNLDPDPAFFATHPELAPGRYVVLDVADNGSGMEPDTLRRAFEPFFSTKTANDRKGTGLGLSVVYGIVRNHKGVVEIASTPGNGSRLTVHLPVGRLRRLSEPLPIARRAFQPGNGTVLIAEDQPSLRSVLVDMLSLMGYTCLAANDGGAAVELYRQHSGSIDCVLLDLKMPVLSGREAFLKIREMNPRARIVIATGYGLNDEVQDLLDRGAISVCPKPFTKSELAAAIEKALRTDV